MGKNAYLCRVKNVAMLKLIFSPYYDGECYEGNPNKNQCVLGTKYVGPLGLLDELELRAGLSRGETSPMQRAIAYCNAIQTVLDSKPSSKPFYQQSVENDPLGVAQQLLRWRDALCMAGWDKNTELPNTLSADGKKRLEDLQAVEDHFDNIGIGERWHQLLNADLDALLPKDLEIKVDMKKELLPPVIRKVLEKTKRAQESEAVANLGEKTLSDFAGKFTLYQFPEQNDAYQWAATQTEYSPDVYINEDNFTFNQVLKSVGKPLVDASVKGGATELSQLLKLGISLFRNPVNYDNLISYLSIFRHPIDKDLRRELRNHLQKAGGFGEYQGEAFPSVDKEYENRWGMWELSKDNIVQEKDIAKFCKALQDCIKKYTPESEKQIGFIGMQLYSQLSVLEEQTNCLSAYIKGKGTLTNDELEKVVATICQGDAVTTDTAKLGSYNMLKDLKGLAVDMNTVLWLDCVNKPRPRYEYAFLNPSDIDKLGLDIPKPELEMLASDFAERLAVSHADSIIALIPQRKNGERTDENLLITELKTVCPTISNLELSLPNAVTENVLSENVNTQQVEYQVNADLFKNIKTYPPKKEETDDKDGETSTGSAIGYKREEQSYSSLSELINHPFDYVLDYIFSMKDKEEETNLSTIEGNVAHHVIHQMVEECKKNTDAFLKLCSDKDGLNKKLDKAIQDCGLELLLPENSLEVCIFRHTFLTKSIRILARIIEDNDLEIEDSEVNYGVVDGTEFNYKGFIDLVLKKKNKEGNEYEYYIFDFKWTKYPNSREEELMQRKELQLALYEKIMTEKKMNVVMRGYYLLKQGKLLTAYKKFKIDDAITVVPQSPTCDIFEQAINSYKERVDNLFAGKIEEGGGMNGAKFMSTAFWVNKTPSNIDNYYLNNGLERNKKYPKELRMAGYKSDNFGKNGVLKGKIK